MSDTIHIQGLQAPVRIGVPDDERARWQTVELDVTLYPKRDFRNLDDSIEQTIDYERVSLDLKEVAAAKPRKLIETLAEELTACLLTTFPISRVDLTIRKFILPGTQWVGVSVTRSLEDGAQ